MEITVTVMNDRWELAPHEIGLPNSLQERRDPLQLGAVTFVRVENPDRKSEFFPYHSHGFSKIGVVRDQDGGFEALATRIADKTGRKIDV